MSRSVLIFSILIHFLFNNKIIIESNQSFDVEFPESIKNNKKSNKKYKSNTMILKCDESDKDVEKYGIISLEKSKIPNNIDNNPGDSRNMNTKVIRNKEYYHKKCSDFFERVFKCYLENPKDQKKCRKIFKNIDEEILDNCDEEYIHNLLVKYLKNQHPEMNKCELVKMEKNSLDMISFNEMYSSSEITEKEIMLNKENKECIEYGTSPDDDNVMVCLKYD